MFDFTGYAAAALLNAGTVYDLAEYIGYLHIKDENLNKHLDEDLYAEIDLRNCAEKRISEGGTCVESIKKQLEYVKNYIQ